MGYACLDDHIRKIAPGRTIESRFWHEREQSAFSAFSVSSVSVNMAQPTGGRHLILRRRFGPLPEIARMTAAEPDDMQNAVRSAMLIELYGVDCGMELEDTSQGCPADGRIDTTLLNNGMEIVLQFDSGDCTHQDHA